ncbi:unnamed protein product [Ectocarpus sp. 6 AP-2014]
MSVSLNVLLDVRKPDQGLIQVVEAAGLLLGIENTSESQSPEAPVYRTLQAGFASAGNIRGSPGLAPPWATSKSSAFASGGRSPADHHHTGSLQGGFADGTRVLPPGSKTENAWSSSSGSGSSSSGAVGAAARSETNEVVHALKLAVVGVTRRLMDEARLLPLQNRTTAVLVDGSRMSLLALELAGATWKFGRFVVVHVSGEKDPSETTHGYDEEGCGGGEGFSSRRDGPEHEGGTTEMGREGGVRSATAAVGDEGRGACEDAGGRGGGGRDGGGERCGRWHPGFLEAELRETCLRQLEIPEESLELVFRSLPPDSSGNVDEVTKAIDATLAERGVEVVYMGCYGRRGPRVLHFGTVAHWALEQTPYQASYGFSTHHSTVSHMLDKLLPLVSPRDSVVLVHIVDESAEDVIAGEVADIEQVRSDLLSLLSHKRGLSHRVRVETTGRPPEHPTQTVVQKIVKVAEEEVADFLAILYDESRGSYRTVATGCLRETRCGLIAIH